MKISVLVFIAASIAMTSTGQAAMVFLSSSATDPTASPNLTVAPNSTDNMLWVWVDPDDGQVINGLALDLRTDNANLTATEFLIENPGVPGAGPFGSPAPRWQGTPGSGTLGSSPLVDDSNAAFLTTGAGINDFAVAADPLVFDGNYLHGKLTFSAGPAGVTIIQTAVGAGEINTAADGVVVSADGLVNMGFDFAPATITVVPEPSSFILLGLIGAVASMPKFIRRIKK